jgi:hypothetical protein
LLAIKAAATPIKQNTKVISPDTAKNPYLFGYLVYRPEGHVDAWETT